MEFKNHMAEVAKILGVKIGEPFEVCEAGEPITKRHRCMLTNEDMYLWQEDWQEWDYDHDHLLLDLLTGSACVYEA
jgi:hypothetical protein